MVLWPAATTAVVAVAGGVFWQSSSQTPPPPTDRYDSELPWSSFGSYGRLFAVDATLAAVDRHSTASVVCLSCRDGVVTVFTTTQSPYLHSNELVVEPGVDDNNDNDNEWGPVASSRPLSLAAPNIARLDYSFSSSTDDDAAAAAPIMAIVAGTGVDQILLRTLVQEMAERYLRVLLGEGRTTAATSAAAAATGSIARRLADALQLRTQQPSIGRVLVAACLLLDSSHSIVWKIDAAGQFWKLHGGAIGRHAPKIEQYLLQTIMAASTTIGGFSGSTTNNNNSSDTTAVVDPHERIANLTATQAMALARDAIVSAYQQPPPPPPPPSNVTATTTTTTTTASEQDDDDKKQQQQQDAGRSSAVRLSGFVVSRHGHRKTFGHDSLMTMSR